MQTSAPSTSALAHTFRERLKGFLAPLLARLDEQLDSRLVRTLGATVEVLLQNRYSGLLLSELGTFLTSPETAAAGTKRLWKLVYTYARRCQIEMAWRFGKTELAMQSPRLWSWDNRLKLLLIVSLVYAFLLSLLDPLLKPLRDLLLQRFCPRTGKRSRVTPTPLYRIRMALSYLWLCTSSPFLALRQNSG